MSAAAEILATIPITKEVAEVDEKVKALDDEIAAMDRRREEIEREKEDLGKARIAALARTAPINKVLPELLSRIFEYAANESEKEGIECPLRLVLVSHLWRRTALETPRAWGRIAIEVEDDSGARPMIRRAQAFLERSSATPIDVLFDVIQWSRSDDRPRLLKEMLELLAPHMARSTKLVCKAREEDDSPLILNTLTPHFGPSLTDFTMESRDSVRLEMPAMPYLTRLNVDDVGPKTGWTPEIVQNLRSLSLRYFKPIAFEPFLAALESAKDVLEEIRLARCTLAFDSNAFLFTTNEKRPSFSKLRKISVVDVTAGDIDILFESIYAPNLSELFLGLDSARMRYFKFLAADSATCLSRCPLKKIEIEDANIEGSELRTLLELFKAAAGTLEELAISGGELDNRFYHAMEMEPQMLPHLKVITIRRQNDFTGRELLRIVQARQQRDGVSPLHTVGVDKCRAFEHDVGDQLKRTGVKLAFTPY